MAKPFGSPVVDCPSCNKPIGAEHPYAWCSECGTRLPSSILKILPKQAETLKVAPPPILSSTKVGNAQRILMEDKITSTIIPNVKWIGIATAICTTISIMFQDKYNFWLAIEIGIAYIFAIFGVIFLLEALAEIITLLRRIANNGNSSIK